MAKVARIALVTFAVAINVVPGLGQAISSATFTFLGTTIAVSSVIAAGAGALAIASFPAEMLQAIHTGEALVPSSRRGRHGIPAMPSKRWRPRFRLARATGNCLAPYIDDGYGIVFDRTAALRVGDLALFEMKGQPGIFAKRFMGASDAGQLEFHSTNPYRPWFIEPDSIEWLHRIRSVTSSRSKLAHLGMLVRVWLKPHEHNAALGLADGVEHALPPAIEVYRPLGWADGEAWRPEEREASRRVH